MPMWAWVFFSVGAAWGWVGGVLFRAGYLRRMGWNLYFDPHQARPLRNAPIALIPAAGGFTSLLVAVALASAGSPAALIVLLPFFAFVVWALVVAMWPPEFLKPRWLREEEQQRAQRTTH